MLRSLKIGRAFGIPLYLHPTLLLLPALVLWSHLDKGWSVILFFLVAVATLFTCVVLHELGHALMARYFGIRTRDITLYPIGGVARLERMSDRPIEELFIAVAGPAVNVVIAMLLAPLVGVALLRGGVFNPESAAVLGSGSFQVLYNFLAVVMWGNVVLVLFNMLPIFPMDGGRVFRSFLALFFGLRPATEVAAALGLVLAGLLGLLALMTQQWILLCVVLFIAFAGQAELRAVRYREAAQAQARAEQAAMAQQYPAYHPYYGPQYGPQGDPRYGPQFPVLPPAPPPRPVPVRPSQDEDVETVVLRPSLSGEPARTEAPPPARRGGFSGLVWDRDHEVWVRWEDGRPVAAYR